jgi:hypothetical protein
MQNYFSTIFQSDLKKEKNVLNLDDFFNDSGAWTFRQCATLPNNKNVSFKMYEVRLFGNATTLSLTTLGILVRKSTALGIMTLIILDLLVRPESTLSIIDLLERLSTTLGHNDPQHKH